MKVTIENYKDFRQMLQQSLLERCRKNPTYSLRAFARSLKISPSALSAMINGKRKITNKMMHRLGLELSLEMSQIESFSQTDEAEAIAHQIKLDTFAIISEWYHYAILELMRLEHFKSDPKWIAQTLGLTKSEVNIAIERLIRVRLIKINENGSYIDLAADVTTHIEDGLTSQAAKRYQKQILSKAIDAINDVDIKYRDNTSVAFATHLDDIPEIKNRIQKFRKELISFIESKNNRKQDAVYQIGLALYPLSKIDKKTDYL